MTRAEEWIADGGDMQRNTRYAMPVSPHAHHAIAVSTNTSYGYVQWIIYFYEDKSAAIVIGDRWPERHAYASIEALVAKHKRNSIVKEIGSLKTERRKVTWIDRRKSKGDGNE